MAVLVLLALALFAGSACATTSDASRVVGGWPTSVERYPSIVQVEFLENGIWDQWCGATILNNRNVLSAAHCFYEEVYHRYHPTWRRIRAGSAIRHTGGSIVYIERAINHPSFFTGRGFDADLSILRLVSSLEFTPVIQPATIISQGLILPDGLPVQYVGWGHTVEDGESSDDLLETNVYTVNRDVCAENYFEVFEDILPITENMFCAGLINVGGRDGCQGDSGGPVYYEDPSGDFLVGVVSFGHGCGRPEYPGVNTAVSSYTDWIAETAV